jgi:hypothetical protein
LTPIGIRIQRCICFFKTTFPKAAAVVFFHAANDNTISYKAFDWTFETDEKVLPVVKAAISKKK